MSRSALRVITCVICLGLAAIAQGQILPIKGTMNPTMSPDGSMVAFQYQTLSGWRIAVSKLDGSGLKVITSGKRDDVEPSWRSDGKSIVFASNRSGNYDIYTVTPDGARTTRLTKTPQDERMPRWSPRLFGVFEPRDISTRTIPGRSRKALSKTELSLLSEIARGEWWGDYGSKFDIKPDAVYYKLLYLRVSGGRASLCTMRSDGSLVQVVPVNRTGAFAHPCWSPDAKRIAFALPNGGLTTVYVADYPMTLQVNWDENAPAKWGVPETKASSLGSIQGNITGLSWTPNGEFVAAAGDRNVTLLPVPDGLAKNKETATPGLKIRSLSPCWLPDARTVLATVERPAGGPALCEISFRNPLLDIVNVRDFAEGFVTDEDATLLGRNGFVAGGLPAKQMFHTYEKADYENLPVFVTTDTVLHLNHLFFDYILRSIEAERLMPQIAGLTEQYLRNSLEQHAQLKGSDLEKPALNNLAFFAVEAEVLLGKVKTGMKSPDSAPSPSDPLALDSAKLKKQKAAEEAGMLNAMTGPLSALLAQVPPEARQMVDEELALIGEHGGFDRSPIFGGELTMPKHPDDPPAVITQIDYSQFVPRGHYTRSEILRRYFLATRWLSAPPFLREKDKTSQALLILAMSDDAMMNTQRRIAETVATFIGEGDDQSLHDYAVEAKTVFGGRPSLADIRDAAKFTAFMERINALPGPRLAQVIPPSMRMFPQPYTFDAGIQQELVYDERPPDVGTRTVPRYFALGLDVMAVLGSARARTILDNYNFNGQIWEFDLKETEYANYDERFQAMRKMIADMTEADWTSSIYNRVFYSFVPLLTPAGDRGPAFMRNEAWTDKSLNTTLATWTELKHDTMPKQPLAVEMGGEGGLTEAPIFEQPVGYVEPNPEVYRRVLTCVAAERTAIEKAGFLKTDMNQRLEAFTSLLNMLIRIEGMQSSGQRLTNTEIEQLRFYGGFQEHLTMITLQGESGSMDETDMAVVADVATAYINLKQQLLALEEGVGRALPIYAAVPDGQHRRLVAGSVFTYYEFLQPAQDRLTDEKWRELLDKGEGPNLPEWTKSFVSRVEGRGE